MATYAVAAGQIAAHDKQLIANTVDTVTFADNTQLVEVLTDGTAALYFTVDGSTPTVSGATAYKIPAAVSALSVRVPSSAAAVVKLISAGTPVYSVSSA